MEEFDNTGNVKSNQSSSPDAESNPGLGAFLLPRDRERPGKRYGRSEELQLSSRYSLEHKVAWKCPGLQLQPNAGALFQKKMVERLTFIRYGWSAAQNCILLMLRSTENKSESDLSPHF